MPFWNWGRGIGCVSTVSILIPKLHNTSVKGRKLTEFSGIRCRQCSSCKWPALQTLTQSQTELSSPSDPLVDSIAYIMSVRTFWIQVSTILANKRPHPFLPHPSQSLNLSPLVESVRKLLPQDSQGQVALLTLEGLIGLTFGHCELGSANSVKPIAFLDAKRWVPKLTFEATRKSSRSKRTYLMDTVIQSWIQPKMS